MAFIDDIKKRLSKEEFSLKVLNDCRMNFQYGGFDENDELEFKRLLTFNINKYYPNITQLQIDQIARVCIDRGVLETKDILFLDGVAFTIKTDEVFSRGVKYIDYDRQIEYDTLSKQAMKNQIMLETLSEEMRVLYVALTRAKEKLIITGYSTKDK